MGCKITEPTGIHTQSERPKVPSSLEPQEQTVPRAEGRLGAGEPSSAFLCPARKDPGEASCWTHCS